MRGLAMLLPLLFTACFWPPSTGYTIYHLADSTEAPWKIEATWKNLNGHLTVKMDGNRVVDTVLVDFPGSAEAAATYKGRNVFVHLFRSDTFFGAQYVVQVYVEAEIAARFRFGPYLYLNRSQRRNQTPTQSCIEHPTASIVPFFVYLLLYSTRR